MNRPQSPIPNLQSPQSLHILSIPIHIISKARTLRLVQQMITEARLHQLATVNPEFVMTAQEDTTFQQVLCAADLCMADGIGLVMASRWLGQPLPERIPGSELVYDLAQLCAIMGWRLFLLGAAEGVAETAASILQSLHPNLIIAGTHAGSPALAENEAIVQHVNASRADMLFVAYGAPRQDKWIARNREALSTVRVAMGIGGALDFISGKAVRAPRWVQNLGLEWLHRLIKEPWRWRRMLALPRFVIRVIRNERSARHGANGIQ